MKTQQDIVRTDTEIKEMLELASARPGLWEEVGGTDLFKVAYENGVIAALDWVLGKTAEAPIKKPEAQAAAHK